MMRSFGIIFFCTFNMFVKRSISLMQTSRFAAVSRTCVHRMTSSDTTFDYQVMKEKLDRLVSSTARGSNGNNKMEISGLVESFQEAKRRESTPVKIQDLLGEWVLLYTDDDVTRSSPFFWAFRKALRDVEDPFKIVGPKMLSESIFKITDSIPLKSVGTATQTFTVDEDLMEGESLRGGLKSSMEIKVVVAGSSMMTTSSMWRTTDESDLIEIEVQKTEVLDSTVATLFDPIIKMIPKQLADNFISFPSGAALELVKPGSSTVYMRIVYLDETTRIIKNEVDGKTFIYGRY